MKIEDVSGIGFAAGWTTKKKGELPVGSRLLGEIVVDAEHVLGCLALLALPHEVFTHGRTGIGSDVLQRSGTGGTGVDHDRVVHGAIGSKRVDNTGDSRILLTDSDVDADDRVIGAPVFLLVDDGVDGDGGLAGLAVTDDELSLTTSDGNHRVNGLDACLQRFLDGLSGGDTRSHDVELHGLGAVDGALAVQWLTKRIDHSTQHAFADWNFKQSIG